jgi:drug/metabolite transporter (DMT)-like permease
MMYVALALSACLAAGGQVLLKLGADGRVAGLGLVNAHVMAGLTCYLLGLGLWLIALTRLPLSVVYPFTLLTLALVFAASLVMLGERPAPMVLAGWAIIACGIGLIVAGNAA